MIEALRARVVATPKWARWVMGLVVIVGLAVVVLAAPVSDWWSQRHDISRAEEHLSAIQADNQDLRDRMDRIGDPATIEHIARRDLSLVREGEESYMILPPPTAGLVMPDTWPFDRIAASMVNGQ